MVKWLYNEDNKVEYLKIIGYRRGNDYYKDVNLYKEIVGGQPFANFYYVAGVDFAGASLTQNPSTQKFNSIRLRTKVSPFVNSLIKINWFVIGVLS